MPRLLAIETSCDECSAAVLERTPRFVAARSNVIFSQIDLHRRFGGVVPEVASRNHLEMVTPVVEEALEKAGVGFNDLDAVAVTQRPGLIGALLVGVSTAKAIAYALNKPLVGVNHLEGHLHSVFIDGQQGCERLGPQNLPLLACLVSGGHTNLYLIRELPPRGLGAEKLSESRDDAAGEAFDKTAKLLGLPYPGGVHLDRGAKSGNPAAIDFPRALPGRKNMEFSFSGLKTAVATELKKRGFEPYGVGASWGTQPDPAKLPQGKELADFCASIQEAIVQTLLRKIRIALGETGARGLAVVGGVSANSRFRELLATDVKVPVFFPDHQYCTDNAAMIGAAGIFMLERGEVLKGAELLAANAFSS
ncbi:MAG: tRNA (adenosine(37)-N6)-threonylcarbamoyltransferase complex transferase subunit TsaD [Deltaproteobacteria bacterium]|nr:tRNA (adenosine(37)-N6)-threonylcarbamoyltransferase complex transferase subunit TsaD [Deltaproteobacteria bacterium]